MRPILLLCLTIVVMAGCATDKTGDELSETEISALEESQARIVIYRQVLKSIASEPNTPQPGPKLSPEAKQRLRTLISKETELQGAIIHKDPHLPLIAKDVLINIRDGSIELGARLLVALPLIGLQMLTHIK